MIKYKSQLLKKLAIGVIARNGLDMGHSGAVPEAAKFGKWEKSSSLMVINNS